MKTLFLLLSIFITTSLAAQEKQQPYLLVYQVDIGCESDTLYIAGLPCRRKYIDAARTFDTPDAAISFMNTGFFDGLNFSLAPYVHVEGEIWKEVSSFDRNPRLYKVESVPIHQVKTGEYEETEMKPIKVKRDKKEWRIVK